MNTNELIEKYSGELRREGFEKIAELAQHTQGDIAETGCIRTWPGTPDGASTVILASLAWDLCRAFHSFELDASHAATAKTACEETGCIFANIESVNSIVGLRRLERIGVLYLDSFDYEKADPIRCQRHMIAELGAAWGALNERAVIAMDDWNNVDGGKTGLSQPYLLDNGFFLHYEGYMRVFANFQ